MICISILLSQKYSYRCYMSLNNLQKDAKPKNKKSMNLPFWRQVYICYEQTKRVACLLWLELSHWCNQKVFAVGYSEWAGWCERTRGLWFRFHICRKDTKDWGRQTKHTNLGSILCIQNENNRKNSRKIYEKPNRSTLLVIFNKICIKENFPSK